MRAASKESSRSRHFGYRVDNAKNAPTGSHPEGIYLVTSSNSADQWCCFDYGSGENSHTDTGNATMNAIEWGTACWFGGCVGTGPWVEADLENGIYHTTTGSNKDPGNAGVHFPFVSAWEKNNGTSNFALKYGNATSGGLTTTFSGPLPNGYSPMRTDSSLLLGTGGDNSVTGVGYFFEGAVISGYPSDATESAVQNNITTAGYSFGNAGGGGQSNVEVVGGQSGRCLDVTGQSTANGAQAQLWDCSGNPNERWTYTSMGWNDWNAYGCNVSETLVKQTADKMVSAGLASAGYQYVNIDDCWMQHKYDNCSNSGSTTTQQYIARYSAMRDALAATGRPIVYSVCERGVNAPWTWAGGVGNLWRTTGDIQANYASMLSIFHQNVNLAAYAGPGQWNDPDMLEVGNGMSAAEDRSHFSLWAEMAAPLLGELGRSGSQPQSEHGADGRLGPRGSPP
jgi:hypothetical protein